MPNEKKAYCAYCKRMTLHQILSVPNKQGTGGDLRCTVCRSSRLDKIQGMDAELM